MAKSDQTFQHGKGAVKKSLMNSRIKPRTLGWSALPLVLSLLALPLSAGAATPHSSSAAPPGWKVLKSEQSGAPIGGVIASLNAFSVSHIRNPSGFAVRIIGGGDNLYVGVDTHCGIDESLKSYTQAGLHVLPVPAGATMCGVSVNGFGATRFTVQILEKVGAPTSTVAAAPAGWTLLTSATGDSANGWLVEPVVKSVNNLLGLDIRVTGNAGQTTTVAGLICGVGVTVFTDHTFNGAGLFVFPVAAGASNCNISVTATGAGSGSFTVQIYANTSGKPTTTTTPTTTPTTPPKGGASPYCVKSNAGSSGGWNYYRYVDSTSTVPCYGHWNITLGPGCQFYLDGQQYSTGPGNIWNIVTWGFNQGAAIAILQDRHILEYTCRINLSSYPQTSLNSTDWR